jgi:hypothetical protein
MECRCPSCNVILLWTDLIDADSWITCHGCDRGFRPAAARCVDCGSPFGDTVWFGHTCGREKPLGLRLVSAVGN